MLSAPAPGDHFRVLHSVLERLENFSFCMKSYAGYLGFHSYRALGTLEFFLEHRLKKRKIKD